MATSYSDASLMSTFTCLVTAASYWSIGCANCVMFKAVDVMGLNSFGSMRIKKRLQTLSYGVAYRGTSALQEAMLQSTKLSVPADAGWTWMAISSMAHMVTTMMSILGNVVLSDESIRSGAALGRPEANRDEQNEELKAMLEVLYDSLVSHVHVYLCDFWKTLDSVRSDGLARAVYMSRNFIADTESMNSLDELGKHVETLNDCKRNLQMVSNTLNTKYVKERTVTTFNTDPNKAEEVTGISVDMSDIVPVVMGFEADRTADSAHSKNTFVQSFVDYTNAFVRLRVYAQVYKQFPSEDNVDVEFDGTDTVSISFPMLVSEIMAFTDAVRSAGEVSDLFEPLLTKCKEDIVRTCSLDQQSGLMDKQRKKNQLSRELMHVKKQIEVYQGRETMSNAYSVYLEDLQQKFQSCDWTNVDLTELMRAVVDMDFVCESLENAPVYATGAKSTILDADHPVIQFDPSVMDALSAMTDDEAVQYYNDYVTDLSITKLQGVWTGLKNGIDDVPLGSVDSGDGKFTSDSFAPFVLDSNQTTTAGIHLADTLKLDDCGFGSGMFSTAVGETLENIQAIANLVVGQYWVPPSGSGTVTTNDVYTTFKECVRIAKIAEGRRRRVASSHSAIQETALVSQTGFTGTSSTVNLRFADATELNAFLKAPMTADMTFTVPSSASYDTYTNARDFVRDTFFYSNASDDTSLISGGGTSVPEVAAYNSLIRKYVRQYTEYLATLPPQTEFDLVDPTTIAVTDESTFTTAAGEISTFLNDNGFTDAQTYWDGRITKANEIMTKLTDSKTEADTDHNARIGRYTTAKDNLDVQKTTILGDLEKANDALESAIRRMPRVFDGKSIQTQVLDAFRVNSAFVDIDDLVDSPPYRILG